MRFSILFCSHFKNSIINKPHIFLEYAILDRIVFKEKKDEFIRIFFLKIFIQKENIDI